jgi:hypothetical protein
MRRLEPAPFELKKEGSGKYSTPTLGRALLLKRSDPAAWRKLPKALRDQAETTVERIRQAFHDADLLTLAYQMGQMAKGRRRGRPRDAALRRRALRLEAEGLSKWKIGLLLYPSDPSKKAYDKARALFRRLGR